MKAMLQTRHSPPGWGTSLLLQQNCWRLRKAPCMRVLNKCAAAIAPETFQRRYDVMWKAVECRSPANIRDTVSGSECMKDRRCQTSVSQEAVCVSARG